MDEQETGVETTVEETTTQTAPTEETTTDTEGEATTSSDGNDTTEEAPAESETVEEIDYKAELDAAKRQIKQAEHTIVQLKKDSKEEPEDPWGVDEEPDTEKLVDSKVNERMQVFVEDAVDEAIDGLSENPDERKLIEFIYNNKLVKTGYSRKAIKADMEQAYLLANSKRFMTESTELKRTIATKKTITNAGSGSNQDRPESTPKFNEADKRLMDAFGVDPSQVK